MNHYIPKGISTSSIGQVSELISDSMSIQNTEDTRDQIPGTWDWAINQTNEDLNTISTDEWEEIAENSFSKEIQETEENEYTEQDSEAEIGKTIEDIGATDEVLAKWIFRIALQGTKFISTKDDWIVEVEDHWTQLSAWKLLAQMKWHLNQKTKKAKRNSNIKYILIPDWK